MRINKITLYVNNQEEALDFWTNKCNLGLVLKQPMGPDSFWVEVGDANTCFVLYEKEAMKKINPDANLDCPSIIFDSKDIAADMKLLNDNGVKVDDLMDLPYGKMVNFYDQDGNQFLIREG